MGHHGCLWPRAVTIRGRSGLRRAAWRHERRVASRIDDLRANHALRTRDEGCLHHHGTSHLSLLRSHVLGVVGEATVLSDLRCSSRPHEDSLVVRNLG